MAKYSGALELTWTNKHQALLDREGGGYQWVDPTDHRISEVRLLKDAGTVGEVEPDRQRVKDNLLIRGDALNALTSLIKLPEFAEEYKGRVKLVYIDPPFNTGEAFQDYDDNLEHSVWLTMFRDRLLQIRELLAPNGSVWVHLDDIENHRARLVLDELFGLHAHIGDVSWEKSTGRDNRVAISVVTDYLTVYAPDPQTWKAERNLLPFGPQQLARYRNPDDDPRGLWQSGDMTAQAGHATAAQFYELTTPSGRKLNPPPGRCWLYTKPEFERLVADGKVYFGPDGDRVPRFKRFLSEVEGGLVPRSLWMAEEVGTTDNAKKHLKGLLEREPFDTPKPEPLLERIIEIATNPGDIILDCFVGSGTTAAVAHKLGRRWVVSERSEETLATYAIPRLTKVVQGADPGGITVKESREPHPELPDGVDEGEGRRAAAVIRKYLEVGLLEEIPEGTVKRIQKLLRQFDKSKLTLEERWSGGGGFRILDVAASMFIEEEGVVYLADWAVDEALAEPVAAQLGFTYQPEAPFSGRKGRIRLAVVDGIASTGVAEVLIRSLGEGEAVVICGTAVAPEARDYLRSVSPASRIRKIPASILAEYRVAYRHRRAKELLIEEETMKTVGENADPEQVTQEPVNV